MQTLLYFWSILILTRLSRSCMIGDHVKTSVLVDGFCFWVLKGDRFTTWDAASHECRADGGEIASISTVDQAEALRDDIDEPLVFIGLRTEPKYKNYYWHDGSDIAYMQGISRKPETYQRIGLRNDGLWIVMDFEPHDVTTPLLCKADTTYLRCPEVVLEHSQFSREGPTYVGETNTIICNDQTVLDNGDTQLTTSCVNGMKWKPAVQDCKPLRCEHPPIIQYSSLNTLSRDHGTELEYTCILGYLFADSDTVKTITCNGVTGQWGPPDVIDSLNCTEIFCDSEPTIERNIQMTSDRKTKVGSINTFWCLDGFKQQDGTVAVTTECRSSVRGVPYWTITTIPECISFQCKPMAIEDVHTPIPLEETYVIGQTINYFCNPNTQFPGNNLTTQMQCLKTGVWSNQPPISGCDETRCPGRWDRWLSSCYYFSDRSRQGLRFGSAKDFCGLQSAELATVTDKEENKFLANIINAADGSYWLGYHKDENSTGNSWSWMTKEMTSYSNWAPGYPEGYDCGRITIDGWWKDRHCDDFLPYICEKAAVCGDPPVIANGKMVTDLITPVDPGQMVFYECDPGFSLPSAKTEFNATCQVGGVWSLATNCEVTICRSRNQPEYRVNNSYTLSTLNHFGAEVTYKCQLGYLFPDQTNSKTIKCMENREWSATVPSCQQVICKYSDVLNSSAQLDANQYGAVNLFTCDTGFEFRDDGFPNRILTCGENQTWHPKNSVCTRKRCRSIEIDHASYSSEMVNTGESVTITCDRGYKLEDGRKSVQLTCPNTGVFPNLHLIHCSAVYCPGIRPPDEVNAIRSSNDVQGGLEVTYTCLQGHLFSTGRAQAIRICQEDSLTWSESPGGCMSVSQYLTNNLYEHPLPIYRDIVMYGAMGAEIVAVILVLVTIGLVSKPELSLYMKKRADRKQIAKQKLDKEKRRRREAEERIKAEQSTAPTDDTISNDLVEELSIAPTTEDYNPSVDKPLNLPTLLPAEISEVDAASDVEETIEISEPEPEDRRTAFAPKQMSTDALSTDALSTDALSTDALSTDALSTNALSTNALSTDELSTDVLSTEQPLPTTASTTTPNPAEKIAEIDSDDDDDIEELSILPDTTSNGYFKIIIEGATPTFTPKPETIRSGSITPAN